MGKAVISKILSLSFFGSLFSKGLILSGAGLFGLVVGSAHAQIPPHEFMLDNGLKLIVKEDHRAPVMVSQVWYKVGSSYEYNGITGASHLLEHMMFKGTHTYPAGEFSRIIAANGGRENAFTNRDYTAYFQSMEKNRLEVSFKLESDRMQGLLLTEEEFRKEVQVVMEERRLRTEDKPQSLTYERFNAASFLTSPYRNPVIGWMDDLKNLNVDDLKEWYQRWYAPNNATVVVAGDVDPKHVLELAKKYFEPLKPVKVIPPKPQAEPETYGRREIVVKAPAKLPYLIMGYRVPTLATAENKWEPYALEVLAGVLDGGNSSRFSSRLVRGTGIATSAGAGYSAHSRLAGQFLLDGMPGKGKDIESLKQALLLQIKELQEKPVTRSELDRVKAQVVADDVYQNDSVFYQAMQIGTMETVGLGWQILDEYVDQISAVTADQVQEVARKYLVDDRLTIARLDPQPMDQVKPRKISAGVTGGRH